METTDQVIVPLKHGERFELKPDTSGRFTPEAIREQVSQHTARTAELRRGCIPYYEDDRYWGCEPYACDACMGWIEWSSDYTVGIIRCVCLGG